MNFWIWDFGILWNQKCNFFKSTDSQYFFTKFPEINFQVTIRINWCKEHGCGSTYMVVRLSDKRSFHLLVQMFFDHVQIFLTVFNIFWMCSIIFDHAQICKFNNLTVFKKYWTCSKQFEHGKNNFWTRRWNRHNQPAKFINSF